MVADTHANRTQPSGARGCQSLRPLCSGACLGAHAWATRVAGHSTLVRARWSSEQIHSRRCCRWRPMNIARTANKCGAVVFDALLFVVRLNTSQNQDRKVAARQQQQRQLEQQQEQQVQILRRPDRVAPTVSGYRSCWCLLTNPQRDGGGAAAVPFTSPVAPTMVRTTRPEAREPLCSQAFD